MKAQKLTTDLAVAAMLLGMAGLVANVFGLWHYIYLSVAERITEPGPEAQVRSIYVFMNLPLKLGLIVAAIAMLYRLHWARWALTVIGTISVVHSAVAAATLKVGVIHYMVTLGTDATSFGRGWVSGWDWIVVVLVAMFYGFLLWHLHRPSTRQEFRRSPTEPIDWPT